jgi:hypothetical protein
MAECPTSLAAARPDTETAGMEQHFNAHRFLYSYVRIKIVIHAGENKIFFIVFYKGNLDIKSAVPLIIQMF